MLQIRDLRYKLLTQDWIYVMWYSIQNSHYLKIAPCQYPFNKSVVKSFTLSKGLQTVTLNDVFTRSCPDRIYMCMVESDSFVGSFIKNPFFFQHMNLSELGFFVNNRSLPGAPVKMEFTDNPYKSNFIEMYQNLCNMHKNINITYKDFFLGVLLSLHLIYRVPKRAEWLAIPF